MWLRNSSIKNTATGAVLVGVLWLCMVVAAAAEIILPKMTEFSQGEFVAVLQSHGIPVTEKGTTLVVGGRINLLLQRGAEFTRLESGGSPPNELYTFSIRTKHGSFYLRLGQYESPDEWDAEVKAWQAAPIEDVPYSTEREYYFEGSSLVGVFVIYRGDCGFAFCRP